MTLRVRDRVLAVADSGGAGPAVLWIHAFPLNGEIFRNQTRLAGTRHVVPDLPGFGRSRDAEPFGSIDDTADALFELMTQLGIFEFTVAGVSMGGYLALAMMRSASDRIRAAVLMDTRETADSAEARDNRFRQIAAIESGGPGQLYEDMSAKLVAPAAGEALRTEVRSMMEQASSRGVTEALRMMASRPDATADLASWTKPGLLVFGGEDAITPPAEGERMTRINPQFRLTVVPGAGHLACLEKPEEVNAELGRFLEELR